MLKINWCKDWGITLLIYIQQELLSFKVLQLDTDIVPVEFFTKNLGAILINMSQWTIKWKCM